LGQLTQLEHLTIQNNRLTELPDSLGQLTQLRYLDISGEATPGNNPLIKLPESIGQLTQLRHLKASGNRLAELPESLGQVTHLRDLELRSNQLTVLPESLGKLTELRSLDVSRNQLIALPESLGQLTQLQNLSLWGNRLTSLPESLGQLTQLLTLHLSAIHITGSEPSRRGLLAVIRAAFDEQHRELKGLSVEERVLIRNEPGVTVSYWDLLKREDRGEEEFYPENMERRVSVAELLNGMETKASRKQRREEKRTHADLRSKEERKPMKKTVVKLDLEGYSRTAGEVDAHVGAEGDILLKQQIRSLIDAGLSSVGSTWRLAVIEPTGDGAVLKFDLAADAHRFAEAVHAACSDHNRDRTDPKSHRWFRVGIATGDFAAKGTGSNRIVGGYVISRAARLEAAANAGEILVDKETYNALPESLRTTRYGAEEIIPGKEPEKFLAHRCAVVRGLTVGTPVALNPQQAHRIPPAQRRRG
jgi:class 3 adenylate cyclase